MRVLAWAVLALALFSAAGQTVVVSSSAAAFQAAVGATGDGGRYEILLRSAQASEWVRAPNQTFLVTGTNQTIDQAGALRRVVEVFWSRPAPAGRETRAFIDVATRQIIRRDTVSPLDAEASTLIRSHFGPRPFAGWFRVPDSTVFAYAGATYAVGADLSGATWPVYVSEWGLTDRAVGDLALRSWVNATGQVDGRPAIEIRTEGRFRLNLTASPFLAPSYRVPFLSFEIPRQSTLEFWVVTWLVKDLPYPLLIEEHIHVNGTLAGEARKFLAAFTGGNEPIPWEAALDPPSPPRVERSPPEARFPRMGTNMSFCLSVDQAYRELESNPEFAPFQAWRRGHPGAQVVGLEGSCIAPARRWSFLFAVPTGDAYGVSVVSGRPENAHLGPEQALLIGLKDGPGHVPPFDVDILPRGPATFAYAAQLWSAYADVPYVDQGPNLVRWGWLWIRYVDSLFLLIPPMDPTMIAIFWLSPNSTSGLFPLIEGITFSALHVHVETGETALGTAFFEGAQGGAVVDPRHYRRLRQMDEAVGLLNPPAATSAELANPPRFDITVGAWTSASMLFVLLAAYFYPLCKFLATRAVQPLFGFARLRSEDLLENRIRSDLNAAIKADPGITPPALQALVQAGWSTVVYHLSVLERNGAVSSMIDGRHKRFFPVGQIDHGRRGQLAALKNARTRQLFQFLMLNPGARQRDLARALHVSTPSTIWHLQRLERVGLVARRKAGRRAHYFPEPPPAPFLKEAVGTDSASMGPPGDPQTST